MASSSSELVEQVQSELTHLLNGALDRIQHCVSQLSAEQIWWRPAPDQNSIGIVMRHVAGNLQQWVVDGIPQNANSRDRDAEFEATEQESSEQLLAELCRVVSAANDVVSQLSNEDFLQKRQIQEFDVTVLGAAMHSIPHFVGHTHQIVQLTRLQLGSQYKFHWVPEAARNNVPL